MRLGENRPVELYVRQGDTHLVENPANYRWSSYTANALGQSDSLITPHPLYIPRNATIYIN